MPTVALDVDLKVANALAELKRLSPGADKEAKAITAALGKSLRDAEKDAKKLGDTAASSGGKALKAMGPLGGVLAKISPAAGSASASIAGMTSAVEAFEASGFAPAVAALAVVLGGAALAWEGYNANANEAAAIAVTLKTAHTELLPALEAARIAEINLAVATKQITEEAGRLEIAGIHSLAAFADATKTAQARMKELAAGTGSWSRTIGDLGEALDGTPLFGLGMEIDAFTTSTSEAEAETALLAGTIQEAHDTIKRTTVAEKELANETGKAGKSARVARDDFKALNDEMERADKAANAASSAYYSTLDSLQAMEAASKRALMSETERADADYAASLAKSAQLAHESEAYATSVSARETIDAQRRQTDLAAEAEYQAGIVALGVAARQELDAKAKESAAQQIENQQAMGAAIIGIGDAVLGATNKQQDTTTREGRRAALAQFAVQKGVMLGQAVIAGALAIQQALASSPPPASYALAAATGVAAAIEIATIAGTQPKFHRGYAPDEMQATVLRRESVLSTTATAAVGADKVRDLNAGVTRGGGGYDGPAPIVVGHRVFDVLIKRELRSSGALSVALSSGRGIPGHRKNRRGSTG